MLSCPHPVFGDWCYCQPGDSQRLLDRQLSYRDAALKEDPSFSGMPPEFEQWCKKHLAAFQPGARLLPQAGRDPHPGPSQQDQQPAEGD